MPTVTPYTSVPSDKVAGNPIKASEWNQGYQNQDAIKDAVESLVLAPAMAYNNADATYTIDVTIDATSTWIVTGSVLAWDSIAGRYNWHGQAQGIVVAGSITSQNSYFINVVNTTPPTTLTLSIPVAGTLRLTVPGTGANHGGYKMLRAVKIA